MSATAFVPDSFIAVNLNVPISTTVRTDTILVAGFNNFAIHFTSSAAGSTIAWSHVDPSDGSTVIVERSLGTIVSGSNFIVFGAGTALGAGDVFVYGKVAWTAAASPALTINCQLFEMAVR